MQLTYNAVAVNVFLTNKAAAVLLHFEAVLPTLYINMFYATQLSFYFIFLTSNSCSQTVEVATRTDAEQLNPKVFNDAILNVNIKCDGLCGGT